MSDKLKKALEILGTNWVLHPQSTFNTKLWADHRAVKLLNYLGNSNVVKAQT